MYILGIKPSNCKYFGTHDSAVSLLKNGEIISLIEEERFTRVKHAVNEFPTKSIKYVLAHNNITLSVPFQHSEWLFVKNRKKDEVISEAKGLIYSELKNYFGKVKLPEISFHGAL